MGQLEGKVAIVTGGASGIGAACAATLAREGAKVVITDIDDAGAQAVVGKIVAAGGEAICLHQDVSIEEDWPGVIEATERRFGQLNVMMANAGIGILCKAIEMSLATARSDDQNSYARLAPAAADQLGIGEVTLLVIRLDGHVGLRADRNHIEALMAYDALLVSGRT